MLLPDQKRHRQRQRQRANETEEKIKRQIIEFLKRKREKIERKKQHVIKSRVSETN